jgi:hypothetical protein
MGSQPAPLAPGRLRQDLVRGQEGIAVGPSRGHNDGIPTTRPMRPSNQLASFDLAALSRLRPAHQLSAYANAAEKKKWWSATKGAPNRTGNRRSISYWSRDEGSGLAGRMRISVSSQRPCHHGSSSVWRELQASGSA